jgi:hypothetical protein
MTRHPPATSATASNAKITHTTATSPTSAISHNAKQTSMPVCPRMRAARAAMPASTMTALGGPMTPRKHVQASKDAAAMNARRGGSAPRASKNRQTWNRGARGEAGVPSGSAAVVVEWDGVAMCYPVRQRGAATLRSRNYSLAVRNNQRKVWTAWLSQTKAARVRRAAREMSDKGRPCLGMTPAYTATQIAGSAVRTTSPRASVFAEPMGDRIGRTESRTLAPISGSTKPATGVLPVERRTGEFYRQKLCRSHLARRPDRQPQYLAKCAQIRIPWSNMIIFPKIDACRADADLFSNFGHR